MASAILLLVRVVAHGPAGEHEAEVLEAQAENIHQRKVRSRVG